MSYIDRHRPAPLGAESIHRAASALGEVAGKLRRPVFTLAALGQIGLGVADMPARRPGRLARIVAAVRDWDARRRTVAELERLTDAQLNDIGLTRGQIYELRSNGRFI